MAVLALARRITARHPRFSDLTPFLKIHAKQRAQKYTTARSSLLVLSYKAVPVVLRDGPSFTSASIAYRFIFLKTSQDGIETIFVH
jgi:hypothetical protein